MRRSGEEVIENTIRRVVQETLGNRRREDPVRRGYFKKGQEEYPKGKNITKQWGGRRDLTEIWRVNSLSCMLGS